MSSTIDQRSSKGHEHVEGTQSNELEYATYMQTPNVRLQGGYSQTNMPQPVQVPDPYANYYQPYVQFPGQMLPTASGGVWSSDPSAGMSYGNGYGNEYMQYGAGMGASYDYSTFSWFPAGMDYGGATWGPSIMPIPQSTKSARDGYASNGYYDENEGIAPLGGGAQTGLIDGTVGYAPVEAELNGSIATVEQGFKTMRMSSGDDGEDTAYKSSPSKNNGSSAGGAAASVVASAATNNHHGSGTTSANNSSSSGKKSWANIASQPAKTILARPKQPVAGPAQPSAQQQQPSTSVVRATAPAWAGSNGRGGSAPQGDAGFVRNSAMKENFQDPSAAPHAVNINPKDFDLSAKGARFFVIKSFSEDDIHRSIKFSIWCSTEYGNKRLDAAWHELEGKGAVYLLFSVNGSGHFCGMAQMTSAVDYHSTSTVWAQDKWKGVFNVKWIFVKDVPNSQLRHIKLENNEGKPVTNSRDTQEVPADKGRQVLRIIAQYRHTTSIFDDFGHYEKQLEEGGGNSNGSASTVSNVTGSSNNSNSGLTASNKKQ